MRAATLLSHHPRVLASGVIGLMAGLAIFTAPTVTRILIGWNCAVWLYLALFAILVLRSRPDAVKRSAAAEDENAETVLAIITIAAVASLVAIVFDLAGVSRFASDAKGLHHALAGITVLGSWFLIGVIFTTHYAHMFYSAARGQAVLRFPDDIQKPDYWDFLYFAFTINVAVQTSDVTIMSSAMRRVVLAHSVVSFLFNTAILGFCINIAAGLTAG